MIAALPFEVDQEGFEERHVEILKPQLRRCVPESSLCKAQEKTEGVAVYASGCPATGAT
jgi:hypothetical protein